MDGILFFLFIDFIFAVTSWIEVRAYSFYSAHYRGPIGCLASPKCGYQLSTL